MSEPLKLSDGTYLYPIPGRSNIHTDHYHVAEDGTILSVKENGEQSYSRSEVRRHINAVTGLEFPPRYT